MNGGDLTDGQLALVKQEFNKWYESRPKWYQIRKRRDTQSVLFATILAAIFVFYDRVIETDKALVNDTVHSFLGTQSFLNKWVKGPEFTNSTESAMNIVADKALDGPNPLVRLTKYAMRHDPVVIFQGDMIFGQETKTTITNNACEVLLLHLASIDENLIPETQKTKSAREICQLDLNINSPTVLNMPFYARISTDEQTPPRGHEIWVVIKAESFLTTTGGIARAVFRLSDWVDVAYVSEDPNQANAEGSDPKTIPLTPALTNKGNGFFVGRVDDLIGANLDVMDPDHPQNFVHSLVITPSTGLLPKQAVGVSALVLVNKHPHRLTE